MDFGEDLTDEEPKKLPEIERTNHRQTCLSLCNLFTPGIWTIAGRINEVLPEIPVYFSDISRSIQETVFTFTRKGKINRETIDIQAEVPIKINNNLVFKPLLVDHSAYNSFMFLIEADGKRVLYTGDYRNHGYKGKLFKPMLKKIRQIRCPYYRGDCLVKTSSKSTNRGRTGSRNSRENQAI